MSDRKSELAKNLAEVESRIEDALARSGRSRSEVTLIAVTKFFPISDLEILYELGLREFGENRDSEGAEKSGLLPEDIRWHFQGQVQGRKSPSIARWASTVHSLDSLEHAMKFDQLLAQRGEEKDFFIQLNLEPDRADRGGIDPAVLAPFIDGIGELAHIRLKGLMAVLPLEWEPREGFEQVASLARREQISGLSIGMSGDFELAIEAGATHIRVGSSILGSRPALT